MITLSICVTDIPKNAIIMSEKNGKRYLSIVVDNLKEVDRFGNTHSVKLSQSKEDRANKVKPTYIGNGKEWVNQFTNQPKPVATPQNESFDNSDFSF